MGDRLRLLSANLAAGKACPDAFADMVRETDADIVAVQELWPEQADALAAVLPHGQLEPSRDYFGMGIALRGPASHDRIPLAYRDARVARITPTAWPFLPRPLEILNVHIASPAGFIRRFIRRHRQVGALLRYLDSAPDAPRVAIGDFNATPIWPAYRQVASRLADLPLHHARAAGRRPEPTWRGVRGGPRLLRIDHCFGRGVRADAVRVLDIRGSDHRALVVDLTVE